MIGMLLLNRYELLEKIGEGGMGIVFKAKCHLLNRFVAVKILKAEFVNDKDFVDRFKREANSVASLSHPNIVNVHDVGEEDNVSFIVMEYINGKTLKQVIKEDVRLSFEKTIDIALQIARALECAHKHNIIHRDIKPDNILITEDNIVKITDFGIAKIVDSTTMTNSNKVIGSVHYFSPEQAKGSSVDGRTDIYSLGIVMYEMVAGRVPYEAENSISVAVMHIQVLAIPPKEIIKDIPESINQVILKALEKEPSNRFQTATEMAEVLNEIKEDFNYRNRSQEATRLMAAVVTSDTRNDFTTVMNQNSDPVKSIIKEDNRISKNKKIMIIIASIILVLIIGVLVKYISKGPSSGTSTPIAKNALPKAIEKKPVPLLIGSSQATAEQTIVNNGFLLGTVSNDFSDSVAKGLVMGQTPEANTSYEKGSKITLVISQGKKIVQVTMPPLDGKTLDEAQGILEGLQLKLGVETPVILNEKGPKGNHSKNSSEKIFLQSIEAGTLVDVGTAINVSYYKNK